jgi:hypothetical protein
VPTAAAAAADLIRQMVQFGWLVLGGKYANNIRATSHISTLYSAEPDLVKLVSLQGAAYMEPLVGQ